MRADYYRRAAEGWRRIASAKTNRSDYATQPNLAISLGPGDFFRGLRGGRRGGARRVGANEHSIHREGLFNNSPIGRNIKSLDPSGIGIRLEATEVEAVAAFLRAINVLENIRSSVDLESRAKAGASFSQAKELLKLSLSELDDAVEGLNGGGLHPEAQKKLRQAAAIDAVALVTPNPSLRNQLINQAIALKNAARADIVF